MMNNTVLIVLGLLVVVALIAFMLSRSKANQRPATPIRRQTPRTIDRQADTPAPTRAPEPRTPTPAPAAKTPVVPPPPATPTPAPMAAPVASPVAEPAPLEFTSTQTATSTASLMAAQQLIAQQQHPQAVEMLSRIATTDPDYGAAQIQLLDLYGQQQEAQQFDTQLSKIEALGRPELNQQAMDVMHRYFGAPDVPTDLNQPLAFTGTNTATTGSDNTIEFERSMSTPVSTPSSAPATNEFSLEDLERDLHEPLATQRLEVPPNSTVTLEPSLPEMTFNASSAPVAQAATRAMPAQDAPLDLAFDLTDDFAVSQEVKPDGQLVPDLAGDLAHQDFQVNPSTTPAQPAPVLTPGTDQADMDSIQFRSAMPATSFAQVPDAASAAFQPHPQGDIITQLRQEFPFLDELDEYQTRLDLAERYIDLGEVTGARELLADVMAAGNPIQQQQARELLGRLSA